MMPGDRFSHSFTWAALAASASTLVCCALPALLVAVGAGAVLASLVSVVPQLVWISEHKTAVFAVAAVMLAMAGALQWQARNAPCPTDERLAALCTRSRRVSRLIYYASLLIFLGGAYFAFVAAGE